MGKKDFITCKKIQKMQVSQDVYWSLLRNRNCFLQKDTYTNLSRDPFSANNKACHSQMGLIANGKRTGVQNVAGDVATGKSGRVTFMTKVAQRLQVQPQNPKAVAKKGKKIRKPAFVVSQNVSD